MDEPTQESFQDVYIGGEGKRLVHCFTPVPGHHGLIPCNITSFNGSSCANNGKGALNTPGLIPCIHVSQVGSHFHFIEANPYLEFDRGLAFGKRLNIPAGTAARFEPGEKKAVWLVDIAGKRVVWGGNNLTNGPVKPERLPEVLTRVVANGFKVTSPISLLKVLGQLLTPQTTQ
eukprot:276543-Prorocentrum_minimum.AAC.3